VFRVLVLALAVSTASSAQQQPMTLDAAVQMALQRNTDLQRQVLLSLSAEQDKMIARSAILPTVDFNASVGVTRQGSGSVIVQGVSFPQSAAVYSTGSAGLVVRQLVFDGGKWWNNIASSKSGLEAGQHATAEQRLQVAFVVAQRFYDLVRAQRFARVMAGAATRSAEQATATDRLAPVGRATQADVLAARA